MGQLIKQGILGVTAFLPKREGAEGFWQIQENCFPRAGQLQPWSTGCQQLLISLCFCATALLSLTPVNLTATDSVQPKRTLSPFLGHKISTPSLSFCNLFCRLLFYMQCFGNPQLGMGIYKSPACHIQAVNSAK